MIKMLFMSAVDFLFNIVFNVDGEPRIVRTRRALQSMSEQERAAAQAARAAQAAEREHTAQLKELDSAIQQNTNSFKSLAGLLTTGLFAGQVSSTMQALGAQEQLKNSLTSLIYTNAQTRDSLGQNLSVMEKWKLSSAEAANTYKALDQIQAKTKFNLNDLGEMFKSFYSTASKSMGLQDALKVMEAIAYSAQVSGAGVDSLKATLDSLGDGSAATATDFGRFVNSLGLTTEAMKKAKEEGNLANLMLEKMGKFKDTAQMSAGSWEEVWSNFTNAINTLKENALAPYFESIKKTFAGWTQYLEKNADLLKNIVASCMKFGKVLLALGAGFVAYKAQMLAASLATKAYTLAQGALAGSVGVTTLALKAMRMAILRLGIPAMIALAVELWLNWDQITKWMKGAWEKSLYAIKALWHNVLTGLKIALKSYAHFYISTLEAMLSKLTQALGGFAPAFLKSTTHILSQTKARYTQELAALKNSFQSLSAPSTPTKSTPTKTPTPTKPPQASLVWNLQKPTPSVQKAKANTDALARALREIARGSMSEYERKLDDIKQKTQEWIKAGVSKNLALKEQARLIAQLSEQNQENQRLAVLDFLDKKRALQSALAPKESAELEAEKTRYEEAIRHLNQEAQEKFKNHLWSVEQIEQLYTLETRLHEKKLKDLAENALKAKEEARARALALKMEQINAQAQVDLDIRQKSIDLMDEGLNKQIALEKLRHDQVLANLNKEMEARLKAGKITQAQANKLYALEEETHKKRLLDIQNQAKAEPPQKRELGALFKMDLAGVMSTAFTKGSEAAHDKMADMFASSFKQGFLGPLLSGDLQGALKSVLGPQFEIKAGSFLDKFQGVLNTFSAGFQTLLAGFGAGMAAGGLVGGFIDTQGDKQAQKRMKMGTTLGSLSGAGVGAALSPVLGPLGPVLGGVFGGVLGTLIGGFSSKKVETTLVDKGIKFFNDATSKSVNASFYELKKESTTKSSWWGLVKNTSTRFWTEYARVGTYASDQIKKSLATYEDLVEDLLGVRKSLSIQAGKYKDTSSALATSIDAVIAAGLGVAQKTLQRRVEFGTMIKDKWGEREYGSYANMYQNYGEDLAKKRGGRLLDTWHQDYWLEDKKKQIYKINRAFKIEGYYTNPIVEKVRKYWEDYAKGLKRDINQVVQETLGNFVKKGQEFKQWKFRFKEDNIGEQKYLEELAQQQKQRLLDLLDLKGVDVNMDNFLDIRQSVLVKSMDPRTIELLNGLGDSIMRAADAHKAYEQALKAQNKTTKAAIDLEREKEKLRFRDLLLERTKRAQSPSQAPNTDPTNAKILSTLQSMLSLQRETAAL
ncbi:phage tail tape measure protein [Helicobacter cynogastricus]|uniref:hypothetical protein n=1 Tax=Helicobacter cynogastricus TaxID=329937 RepID=UPI0013156979|nr:hypothetical protein [Helicobacter cynogastricus]